MINRLNLDAATVINVRPLPSGQVEVLIDVSRRDYERLLMDPEGMRYSIPGAGPYDLEAGQGRFTRPLETGAHSAPTCSHCGGEARGFATVGGIRVCHHETRDCYRDITVHGQRLGMPEAKG